MNQDWQESPEKDQAIVNVEGVPKHGENGEITRRELLTFSAVCELVGRKFREAGELGEEYVRAKVVQETNSARKTAEDAAEAVSRREQNEANADLLRQQAAAKFIENLHDLAGLGPLQQTLAMAKILEKNPDITEQLDRVHSLIELLGVTRGVVVEQQGEAPAAIVKSPDAKVEGV